MLMLKARETLPRKHFHSRSKCLPESDPARGLDQAETHRPAAMLPNEVAGHARISRLSARHSVCLILLARRVTSSDICLCGCAVAQHNLTERLRTIYNSWTYSRTSSFFCFLNRIWPPALNGRFWGVFGHPSGLVRMLSRSMKLSCIELRIREVF
jgi:hypothetical protein